MKTLVFLLAATSLLILNTMAVPPSPSPICHVTGVINSVEFMEVYDNPCLQDDSCPTDVQLHTPARYKLIVSIIEASYVSGETGISCESLYPAGSKEIFIHEEDVVEDSLLRENLKIEGNVSRFWYRRFTTYTLSEAPEYQLSSTLRLLNILGEFLKLEFMIDICQSNLDCDEGEYCVHERCRDVPVFCGDDYCDPGENCDNCLSDCACPERSECINATCVKNIECGDGYCENSEVENWFNCGSDCPLKPLGAPCDSDEDCTENLNCTRRLCMSNESVCGDGVCNDRYSECPEDCCGNGFCRSREECPEDCGVCGDGECTHEEDSNNCEEDCCHRGWLPKERCSENVLQKKYQTRNCEVIWRDYEICARTCEKETCRGIGSIELEYVFLKADLKFSDINRYDRQKEEGMGTYYGASYSNKEGDVFELRIWDIGVTNDVYWISFTIETPYNADWYQRRWYRLWDERGSNVVKVCAWQNNDNTICYRPILVTLEDVYYSEAV